MPKKPFHQTFPLLIVNINSTALVRIVKMIGNCTCFPHDGIDTLNAWGRTMVRLGLAKDSMTVGNPHDFIPEESGNGRKPFHDALLHIIPRIQDEVELTFVCELINQTEIPQQGRVAIEHAWQLQLEMLGHIHDIDAADYVIDFDTLPKELPATAKLERAA